MSSAAAIQAAKIASSTTPSARIDGSAGEFMTAKPSRQVSVEPALAPPAHLIEADGDERPDQRKSRREREGKLERARERRHPDQRDPGDRVEKADEDRIGRHREEVVEALREGGETVARTDGPDLRRGRGDVSGPK